MFIIAGFPQVLETLEKSWNFKIRFKGLEKSLNSVTLYKGPWIQSMVLEYFTFLALFA